jgi:hypothetical protein
MDQYLKAAIDANNGKAVIINQCGGGLGDQLFIEPIMRHFHERGFVVINVVMPEHFWLSEYIQYVHYRRLNEMPGFDREQCTGHYEYEGLPVIPLRFANPLVKGIEPHCGDDRNNWMYDKYVYMNMPVDTWKTLQWTRNEAKEEKLFRSLRITGDYTFVNDNFGGGFASAGSEIKTELPIVKMRKIEGYTMLDWAKVIINASEIHTVETSVIYMIESLPVKAEMWHLYPRRPYDTNCDQVKNILSLDKWIFHEDN